MDLIRLRDVSAVTNPRGVQVRHLIRRKDVAVSNLVLQPGEVLAVHTTPVDVFWW